MPDLVLLADLFVVAVAYAAADLFAAEERNGSKIGNMAPTLTTKERMAAGRGFDLFGWLVQIRHSLCQLFKAR